jgi:ABC-type iron transport system FetAB ATPase subunit
MATNGAASGEPLIKLQGIQKVFYTDEVETHALEDVHLQIMKGEYIAISGPSGCCPCSACSTRPPRGSTCWRDRRWPTSTPPSARA